jgi:glycosyltransferase involved in cell wall biosynthesis
VPSAHEGMSFSLLEAASAGAKIIASDIPANSGVCREYARLVAVGSIEAMREAIDLEWIRERGDEEIAHQITLCRSRHDWRAIVGSMIPILLPADRNQNIDAKSPDWGCRS